MIMSSVQRNRFLPIGLDLGTTSVRAVQLCRRANALAVHAALEVTPAETESPPPNQDPVAPDPYNQPETTTDPTTEALTDQLHRLAAYPVFHGREVILHCPASKLDLRPVQLPCGPEGLSREAILGVIKLQTGPHSGATAHEVVCDYYLADHDQARGRMTVIAITADAAWIKSRISLAQAAGWNCLAVESLPAALSRLVAAPPLSHEPTSDEAPGETNAPEQLDHPRDWLIALLDIGFHGSTLVVRNQNGPVMCRSFPFGAQLMRDTIAQRLAVPPAYAEKLRTAHGFEFRSVAPACLQPAHAVATIAPDPPAPQPAPQSSPHDPQISRAIYDAVHDHLVDFAEGLTRALNYIINEYRAAELHRITVCGAPAHTRNLAAFLADQFELPVDCIDHPLLPQITSFLPPSRVLPGIWSTALGLALTREDC